MVEENAYKIFEEQVVPIMNKVRDDLNNKRADEISAKQNSFAWLAAGSVGPDGGMCAQTVVTDTLKYTGKWNSKTTEDYILMVKDELYRNHIKVDAALEKMMIEKMINENVPKSSAEYILKKAATNTIFYIPQEVSKSPLDHHIEEEAKKRYNPTTMEKGTGMVLGAATDYLCFGGMGGSVKTAAQWIGADIILNNMMDSDKEDAGIPLIIEPKHEEEYKKLQEIKAKENIDNSTSKETEEKAIETEFVMNDTSEKEKEPITEVQVEESRTNQNGWGGFLASFGLNNISDIGHNLGYVMAMLPDILVGALTDKSKSLKIQDNLMPLASIVAGLFVKNPILKMILVGMGGLNLLNKAGHEAIQRQKTKPDEYIGRNNYRVYQDETLDPRISNPQLQGNCLIASIDKIPYTIALPDKVIEAYKQGALPLNTLANAILVKKDQMQQLASQNFEQNQQQNSTRVLTQR